MKKKESNGFTLLELLVVIAILGVLSAILFATYPGAQRRARDARRQSDLKQYQVALETYANRNNGFYPNHPSGVYTSIGAGATLCFSLGLFGSSCPDNPTPGLGKSYQYYSTGSLGGPEGTPTATAYVLYTRVENPVSPVTYWVLCSTGISGMSTSAPTWGDCPI